MSERQPLLGGSAGKTDGERIGSIWRSFVMVAALGALLTAYGQMYGLGKRASVTMRAGQTAAQFTAARSADPPRAGGAGAAGAAVLTSAPGITPAGLSRPTPAPKTNKTLTVQERFRSAGKMHLYHGGDLEAPGELERAVAMRSYNGELVLTYANEAGTAWAANLIFSLRHIGIDHSMVIVMSKPHCDALATSRYEISCGWSSWDMEGCKADDGPVPQWAFIERLWFIRHHYLARLIRLRVNVMALDGDMIMHGDPYAFLHAPPLGTHQMVITSDGAFAATEVNNGFLYLRGCAAGGQVERVLREVVLREMDVCRGGDGVFGVNGSFWQPLDKAGITAGPHHIAFTGARDQKYYQDVLASAFCGRKVVHRMPFASHKVLDGARFDEALAGADLRSCARFLDPPTHSELVAAAARPGERGPPLRVPWHALKLPLSRAGPGSVLPDRDGAALPGAAPPAAESIALLTAPALSTWHGTATGEIAGWSGHWIRAPPMITHFVGCLSKAEAMQSLGWWHYESDDLSAEVARRVKGSVPMGAILPSLLPMARGARVRLLALDGPRLRAPIQKRRAFLEWQLPQRARLAVLAAELARAAVEPLVDCRSAWIPRFARDYLGIRQSPGWPWPFNDGVGVLMGPCADARPEGHPPALCCHPIFGPKIAQSWFPHRAPTVHHRVLEAAAAELGEQTAHALATGGPDAHILRVRVSSVLDAGARLDPALLRQRIGAAGAAGGEPDIVVLVLDEKAAQLPVLGGVTRAAVCKVLREGCRVYYDDWPREHPPPDE